MAVPVRGLAMLLVAVLLSACTSLNTYPGPPRRVVQDIGPRNIVRLTDTHGREVHLANAHIEGDSLVGVRSLASGERVAIAIADVVSVAVGEVDPAKTVLVFLSVALVALVTVWTAFVYTFRGT